MLSQQKPRRLFHGFQVQRFRHHRHKPPFKHAGRLAVPDPVAVGFLPRVQPGVKPRRYLFTGIYADVLRQIPPQIRQYLLRSHSAFAMEIRHLSPGVDPRVGASAAGNLNWLSQNPAERRLQFSLNGVLPVRQTLPAPVARAVIADFKPQIPHTLPVPLWLPARCPQRTGNCPDCHTPECVRERCASDT